MGTIGMAVVFAILLVTANAMMMSERERTRRGGGNEDDRLRRQTLFGVVMLEAAVIAVTGAVIGLVARRCCARRHTALERRLSPRLPRHRRTLASARRSLSCSCRERRLPALGGGAAAGHARAAAGRMKIPFIYNLRSVLQRPARPPSRRSVSLSSSPCSSACWRSPTASRRARPHRIGQQRADPAPRLRYGALERDHRETANLISTSPHVALAADGRPLVSPETYIVLNSSAVGNDTRGRERRRSWHQREGVGCAANIRVVEGRRFASGQIEICVGTKMRRPVQAT